MKKKDNVQVNEEKTSDYYNLKKDAVDDLVDALQNDNSDQITNGEELKIKEGEPNPYKLDRLSRVPTWIKALLIKFWFAGAICYFCLWGLGTYVQSKLDLVVVTGIVTGLITDIIINNAFLYFQSDKKEYEKFMLITVSGKKIWPIFINIIIGIVEVFGVTLIYKLINSGTDNPGSMLGVEPILYGLFFVLVDMTLISIKNLILRVIKKNKNNLRREK